VDVIVEARDDATSVPPSSPPSRADGASEYSSDDGNVAGDEENETLPRYHVMPNGLRRRATVNYISRPKDKLPQGRSLSMGNLLAQDSVLEGRKSTRLFSDSGKHGEGSTGSLR
jgi:hypothetical protein